MQNCVIGFERKSEIVLFISHTKDEEGKNTKFEIKKPKKKRTIETRTMFIFFVEFPLENKTKNVEEKGSKMSFFCRNFI